MSAQAIAEQKIAELSDSPLDQTAPQQSGRHSEQKKSNKRDVHGWVVLDKPVGMTSTHAVTV
ncbi:MAG: tRNA pseudouridine(55) synthase TruB, partial [Xanthobacteraceae bacterium]